MKTIKQWLETLDEPYRSQALENAEYHGNLKKECPTLLNALANAFEWHETKQGRQYWKNLYYSL